MSLTEQLARLSAHNANVMGPSEVKSKHATDLYNNYLKAKDVAAAAPDDLASAEHAYYSYVQGADGYAASKSAQNRAKFEKIRVLLTHEYEDVMRKLNASLKAYDSTKLYAENLSDVAMRYLQDLVTAMETNNWKQSTEQIDYRKTYYLDQETVNLKMANIAFNLLLITLALVFWKRFAYDAGFLFNPLALVGAVLIFFSSWISAAIVYKVMSVEPPKNVYLPESNVWSGTKLSANYT